MPLRMRSLELLVTVRDKSYVLNSYKCTCTLVYVSISEIVMLYNRVTYMII